MAQDRDAEALRLTRELADAVAAGDKAGAIRLTGLLQARLVSHHSDASEPQGAVEQQALTFAAPPSVVPVRRKPESRGSIRQAAVAALAEIGVPSRARLVADYAEARFGAPIDPGAFSGLRRDERRSWLKSAARAIPYVVPAMEGRFFQPIRGLLALSDWPLERRLVGPWSERVDHLAATAHLAKQLAWLNDRDPAVAQRLAPVIAGMAQSIPGAIEGQAVDTARVELAADAERQALAERDEPWRQEAAARARHQLSPEQQLWGTTVEVLAGGER